MSDGLLNQQDIELQMYHGGIARATSLMQRAEEKGRADTNPYSQELYRRFVQPVAHVIREDTAGGKAGRQLAHAALLAPLPAEAVALLAVRCALNGLLQGQDADTVRRLAGALGTTIHRELVLTQIEQQMPELYATLVRDLGRRQSKSEQHRVSAMRASARNAGLTWTEWPVQAVHQVGMYLVGVLEKVGLIEIAAAVADKRVPRAVNLCADVLVTRSRSLPTASGPETQGARRDLLADLRRMREAVRGQVTASEVVHTGLQEADRSRRDTCHGREAAAGHGPGRRVAG